MRLLYICTGNSFRSPVAEALTRKYHPDWEVESAGTDAVDHVAENARVLLEQEEALEYVKPSPDQVSQRAVSEADLIVVMMPLHKDFLQENFDADDKIEVWSIEDPINPGVEPEEAFREIKKRVESMD